MVTAVITDKGWNGLQSSPALVEVVELLQKTPIETLATNAQTQLKPALDALSDMLNEAAAATPNPHRHKPIDLTTQYAEMARLTHRIFLPGHVMMNARTLVNLYDNMGIHPSFPSSKHHYTLHGLKGALGFIGHISKGEHSRQALHAVSLIDDTVLECLSEVGSLGLLDIINNATATTMHDCLIHHFIYYKEAVSPKIFPAPSPILGQPDLMGSIYSMLKLEHLQQDAESWAHAVTRHLYHHQMTDEKRTKLITEADGFFEEANRALEKLKETLPSQDAEAMIAHLCERYLLAYLPVMSPHDPLLERMGEKAEILNIPTARQHIHNEITEKVNKVIEERNAIGRSGAALENETATHRLSSLMKSLCRKDGKLIANNYNSFHQYITLNVANGAYYSIANSLGYETDEGTQNPLTIMVRAIDDYQTVQPQIRAAITPGRSIN